MDVVAFQLLVYFLGSDRLYIIHIHRGRLANHDPRNQKLQHELVIFLQTFVHVQGNLYMCQNLFLCYFLEPIFFYITCYFVTMILLHITSFYTVPMCLKWTLPAPAHSYIDPYQIPTFSRNSKVFGELLPIVPYQPFEWSFIMWLVLVLTQWNGTIFA